ncbi:MAG: hypothetical protein KAU50_03785 [Candidatus Marinimicrobia bacterium]|nr:hypothetical protein [Candidatus Neomarinimicrobiota bacterium]
MGYREALRDSKRAPSKEDLEEILGPARYRRFEMVYDEIIDMDLLAQIKWSKLDGSWFHAFFYEKEYLFGIKWGPDFFYTQMEVDADLCLWLQKNDQLSNDSREILLKNRNQAKGGATVEANLEHPKEQEAFFDLLSLVLSRS